VNFVRKIQPDCIEFNPHSNQ